MKPWLWLPARLSNSLAPYFLRLHGKYKPYQTLTWSPKTWRGIEFTNPLGIAGGVDKNGEHIKDWWTFGPGFLEVGTVTPRPQGSNPGKIIDRNNSYSALWNRMGFPNYGTKYLLSNLLDLPRPHFTPIFANIGMNRQTKIEEAHKDYIYSIRKLAPAVEAFVINISSPNTKGLRSIADPSILDPFLKHIATAIKELPSEKPPLLIKLSPDIEPSKVSEVISICVSNSISGFILTNTTLGGNRKELGFPKDGGVSGAPLKNASLAMLNSTIQSLGQNRKDFLVVSSGGVISPKDVFERLKAGADLVQVYSALIFDGPFFFRKVSDSAETEFF